MASPTPDAPDTADLDARLAQIRHEGRQEGLRLAEQALESALATVRAELTKLGATQSQGPTTLMQSLDVLDLESRTSNLLWWNNIRTVGALVEMSENDLLDISGFGDVSLYHVKKKLTRLGLTLKGDPRSVPNTTTAENLTLDLGQSIDKLDLTARIEFILRQSGIMTIGDLIARSENNLLEMKNFGKKALNEVKTKLDQMGLSLTDDLSRPIEDLLLGLRAYNGLCNAGIRTVGDLVKLSEEELENLRGLGPTSVHEIKWGLQFVTGLRLKGDKPA